MASGVGEHGVPSVSEGETGQDIDVLLTSSDGATSDGTVSDGMALDGQVSDRKALGFDGPLAFQTT